MTKRCKHVYIVEGPDGGGKSTFCLKLAEALGNQAIVSHHGPYPNIVTPAALARIYIDAMLPALLGEHDVILDRSWLSEPIYGEAYRGGACRIDVVTQRQLERLALRCGALVIRCQAPWEQTLATWQRRKGEEYLKTVDQLRQVYEWYDTLHDLTALNVYSYDYTGTNSFITGPEFIIKEREYSYMPKAHFIEKRSAGSSAATVVLVGEAFAKLKDSDHPYQWPFGSLDDRGCSAWLTRQLDSIGVSERDLYWVNADQLTKGDVEDVPAQLAKKIIALGVKASIKLTDLGVIHTIVPHPQNWKRFHYQDVYPLLRVKAMKELAQ